MTLLDETKAAIHLSGDNTNGPIAKTLASSSTMQHYLRAILDLSEDAIISESVDGHIQFLNKAAESILGYSASELVTKNISTIIPADLLSNRKRLIETM